MAIDNLALLVEPELNKVNEKIIEAAANHVELIPRVAKHIIAAGGKRVRPIFTLASAIMCGYEGERHINLAASVEFMHTATLLHDDVVDESDKRRGHDTANFIWGNKCSVLVGDYLLGKAFQMMVSDGSLEVLKILSNAAARIAEGEVMQLSTANDITTTKKQYIDVIKAKTAELFAAACEAGAAITEDEQKQIALREFGMNFGVAFQIVDDALDYSANPQSFGKSIGDDFREGKVTLPIIYAYERGNDKDFWQRVITKGSEVSSDDLNKAKALISETGSFESSIEAAADYVAKAKSHLKIFPESEIKNAFISIADFSVNRSF